MELLLLCDAAKRASAKSAGKKIGEHPDDGKPIELRDGQYGPYVKHGKINASLPKDMEPESLSLELAIELIAARAEKVGAKKAKSKKAKAKKAKGKSKAKGKGKSKAKAKAAPKAEPSPSEEA